MKTHKQYALIASSGVMVATFYTQESALQWANREKMTGYRITTEFDCDKARRVPLSFSDEDLELAIKGLN